MAYYKSRGPGPPIVGRLIHRYFLYLLLSVVVFTFLPVVSSEANKYFDMRGLCKTQFMQSIYQQIDGAVLISKNERNLDCVVTFQTLTVLQRFMLRFDRLKIDCNDHLYIYDVANAVGPYKADLTCRNTTDAFGVMFTGSNYVTLRYVTDAWGTEVNGFELLITAFKNQSVQTCFDFRCAYKNHCISKDLICDGLNHCLDGSDETLPCSNKNGVMLLGMNLSTMVIGIVSICLSILVLLVALITCLCRGDRQPTPRHIPSNMANSTLSFPMEGAYNANGNTIGLSESNMIGCNSVSHKMPGNWDHPAGLKLGYSEVRVRLYCQAKLKIQPLMTVIFLQVRKMSGSFKQCVEVDLLPRLAGCVN
ncbi:uncharacterized protein loaf isoform X2 [Planococcus citri]|uniref:uncharacterized protein loaf isoform X2 n=1 Tax=Planococcus citri TaxID=170843 RepID=UPI0031F762A1